MKRCLKQLRHARFGPVAARVAGKVAAGVAVVLTAAPLAASAQTVVAEDSRIGFVTRQMGVPVEGRFRRWSADVVFDPARPAAGQVAFTIDTASVTLGNAEADAEIVRADWFASARFPRATFVSTAINAAGPHRFEVAGKLTIKGTTRDIVVPVTLEGAVASGSFTIARLAFKVGAGEWADTSLVADPVQVDFKLRLTGLP